MIELLWLQCFFKNICSSCMIRKAILLEADPLSQFPASSCFFLRACAIFATNSNKVQSWFHPTCFSWLFTNCKCDWMGFSQQLVSSCIFSIKVTFVKCMTNSSPVYRFTNMSRGSLELLQSYHGSCFFPLIWHFQIRRSKDLHYFQLLV